MAWGTWGSFGSEAVYCVFACGCARGHAKHATSRVPRGGGFACGALCAHRDARCRVAAGGAHACVSPTRVSPARAPPTTGSPFPLPWKPQLGTGDADVVVLPVVGAHGPPGRVCEHLQHAALTAHAHWGPGHRVVSAGGRKRPCSRRGPLPGPSDLLLGRGAPTPGPRHWWAPSSLGGALLPHGVSPSESKLHGAPLPHARPGAPRARPAGPQGRP